MTADLGEEYLPLRLIDLEDLMDWLLLFTLLVIDSSPGSLLSNPFRMG